MGILVALILLSVSLAFCGFYSYRRDMISRYRNYAGDSMVFIAP